MPWDADLADGYGDAPVLAPPTQALQPVKQPAAPSSAEHRQAVPPPPLMDPPARPVVKMKRGGGRINFTARRPPPRPAPSAPPAPPAPSVPDTPDAPKSPSSPSWSSAPSSPPAPSSRDSPDSPSAPDVPSAPDAPEPTIHVATTPPVDDSDSSLSTVESFVDSEPDEPSVVATEPPAIRQSRSRNETNGTGLLMANPDRAYNEWPDDDGNMVRLPGILMLPENYTTYDREPDRPWICPVRSCRHLYQNSGVLSSHWSKKYGGLHLNDCLDGTFTIVGGPGRRRKDSSVTKLGSPIVVSQGPDDEPIVVPKRAKYTANKSLTWHDVSELDGNIESSAGRQEIPSDSVILFSKSGRRYDQWTDAKTGATEVLNGLIFPDEYKPLYQYPSRPFVCPFRACRMLCVDFISMSCHFRVHRGQLVNDNGDGTLSVVRFTTASKSPPIVVSQKPLDPSEPPMGFPTIPKDSTISRDDLKTGEFKGLGFLIRRRERRERRGAVKPRQAAKPRPAAESRLHQGHDDEAADADEEDEVRARNLRKRRRRRYSQSPSEEPPSEEPPLKRKAAKTKVHPNAGTSAATKARTRPERARIPAPEPPQDELLDTEDEEVEQGYLSAADSTRLGNDDASAATEVEVEARPQPARAPPAESPHDDVLDMELEWERKPGHLLTADSSAPLATRPSIGQTMQLSKYVTIKTQTISPGASFEFLPAFQFLPAAQSRETRFCTMYAGKLRVQVDGEKEFVASSGSTFLVPPGKKGLVVNGYNVEAVVHVTSLME